MAFPRPVAAHAAVAALALAAAGCRTGPPPALEPELASCVPADTLVLAGVRLDRLRANPAFRQLSAGFSVLLDRVRDASMVLVSYDGKDLLFVARGQFRTAPAGVTLLTPRLALAGPEALVKAATAQHAAGRSGAPLLVARAETVALQPVWAVVLGGGTLPLTGNSANLNRFLRYTEYATFTLDVDSGIALHAAGVGRSADAAQQLEETLRGFFSLAAAAEHGRDLARLMASVSVRRDGLTVHADLTAGADEVEKLLGEVAR